MLLPDCDICGAGNATAASPTHTLCAGCAQAEAEKTAAPPPESTQLQPLTIFDPLTGEIVVLWVGP
jgi:hypothetical protein